MFDVLPASHIVREPLSRTIATALLLHLLVAGIALSNTASPRMDTRPIARDTILLDMTGAEAAGPESAESPRPGSDAIIPDAPPVSDILPDAVPEVPPPLGLTLPRRTFPSASTHQLKAGGSAVSLDSSGSLFGTIDVDELPELKGDFRPRYPEALRHAGLSGVVQLQYVIGSDGRMDDRSIRVLSSSHPAFLFAALQALRDARFKPARRGGRPTSVLVQQTIRFRHR